MDTLSRTNPALTRANSRERREGASAREACTAQRVSLALLTHISVLAYMDIFYLKTLCCSPRRCLNQKASSFSGGVPTMCESLTACWELLSPCRKESSSHEKINHGAGVRRWLAPGAPVHPPWLLACACGEQSFFGLPAHSL